MPDDLKRKVDALAPRLSEWRRHLHAHPELSFQEVETQKFVEARLRELGLEPVRPWQTAVVVAVKGSRPGRTVAVRADMDALPIQEATGAPYASTRPGVMHACGHDGHTSILLGLATLLAGEPDFPGEIRLLFQPAEELPPGGAKGMIEAGVLEGVDAVIGLHLIAHQQVGTAAWCEGPMMANADAFTLRIKGKGGHGSSPHQTVDAIAVGAQVVTALQTVVSRRRDPTRPGVLSVGTFNAGFTFNVIAPEAVMRGTARSFDDETRELLERETRRIVEGVAASMGASAEIEWVTGYPAVVNHPEVAGVLAAAARESLGSERVTVQSPVMGGEDFAYFVRERPGAFLYVGAGNRDQGIDSPHHSPTFEIDEASLPLGLEIMARATRRLLAAD